MRTGEHGHDLTALGDGAVDLLARGGHVLDAAAVNTGDGGRAQALGGARRVHGDVAAAHHDDVLAREVGRFARADRAEQLDRGEHALAVLPGDVHAVDDLRADGNVYAVILAADLIEGDPPGRCPHRA